MKSHYPGCMSDEECKCQDHDNEIQDNGAAECLSDTPETDAATHLMQHAPNQWLAVVDAEFGEKLEREKSRLSALYHELLLSVESVHEGETRHQTALRYIRERETFSCAPASDSSENVNVEARRQ